MKTLLLLLGITIATAGAIALAPATTAAPTAPAPLPAVAPVVLEQPRIEAVFVLDTTGSMSGMIQAAKDQIWSIASTMARAQPAPELRIGLVAYRDRGDAYVTRSVPLSADLDSVYTRLLGFEAAGGGDTPESVNAALHEAVHAMSWSDDPDVYRVLFLVGDAPPHMHYAQDVPWQDTLRDATARGIVINTILCGQNEAARVAWTAIATENQGRTFAVDADGGALRIDTPYDDRIAALAARLDRTRLWYGDDDDRASSAAIAEDEAKRRADLPASALASRGVYNATKAGAASLAARNDLIGDIESGEVTLESLDETALPAPLQKMDAEERQAAVAEVQSERAALRQQIGSLAKEREAYLDEAKAERADAKDSLDEQLVDTLREQGRTRGLLIDGPE